MLVTDGSLTGSEHPSLEQGRAIIRDRRSSSTRDLLLEYLPEARDDDQAGTPEAPRTVGLVTERRGLSSRNESRT
jgi:hypothetical protein